MTTAVISPSGFQSLPGLGWNGRNSNPGALSSINSDESSRMFTQPKKSVTRSSSSSSLASTSSTSSTSTVTSSDPVPNLQTNGDVTSNSQKKKTRGGFWPVSKAESTSGVSNARASAVPTANSNGVNGISTKSILQPSPNNANGARSTNGQSGAADQGAVLALIPMNGTFERKQINVPFAPEIVKIGRQTNAKTVPLQINGFFDSKVLSRQHAEIWAERGSGKIWIRDVKSSNGTFVNGQRLSPENRESEPHELRQHDTLELGIDIVSEDQKTIVHRKVSAKVEYAGLPGASNNVLDLNFGDLDPSHGGSLLMSPMSQPMMQSRSRPGGPPNGRTSAQSSVSGAQLSSVAQQRQQNFYGSPLNIEQLVRHLSTEMRAAKQQSQDLEHANLFLNSMIVTDGTNSEIQPPPNELSLHRSQASGRARTSRIDHAARFGDPPAPPPQQPLPEKPDSAKSSPANTTSMDKLLKRSDTAKPSANGHGHSPTGSLNSQILQLVQALDLAKKELDSQGTRVKQLEDMLKEERLAREAAEEKARQFEETAKSRPVSHIEDETVGSQAPPTGMSIIMPDTDIPESQHALQQQLDQVMAEMQKVKDDMEQAFIRADAAENDATSARASLAEMIEQLRKETENENENTAEAIQTGILAFSDTKAMKRSAKDGSGSRNISRGPSANGHVRAPSRLPAHLERAVATVLKQNHGMGEITAQSAPYVSMLGVVLIGVGVMAYLNAWQKGDK